MTTETTTAIEPSLVHRINAAHAECESAAGAALKHAIEAGRLLAEAKSGVGHGSWASWLSENFRGSARTARLYMRLAAGDTRLVQNGNDIADLTLNQASQLLVEKPRQSCPAPINELAAPILPADGKCLFFDVCGIETRWVQLIPSEHPGYYYVNRMVKDCVGDMSPEGTKRPLRADAAASLARQWAGATLGMETETGIGFSEAPLPWKFNHLLYVSYDEWIKFGLLGKTRTEVG